MKNALPYAFFISWLLAGCSVDQIFDDWRASLFFIVFFALTILFTFVIASGEGDD